MIKRYNQFVKNKINEDMVPPANVAPMSSEEDVEIEQLEGELPKAEGPIEDEELGTEQEGGDVYSDNLNTLSELLPGSTVSNNSVIYKEKTILFPSETFNDETGEGVFHVDKKKFKTAQEVADYLLASESTEEISDEREVSDQQAVEDLEMTMQKESKSYRNTRKFQKYKK
jgi:hypothetical protein